MCPCNTNNFPQACIVFLDNSDEAPSSTENYSFTVKWNRSITVDGIYFVTNTIHYNQASLSYCHFFGKITRGLVITAIDTLA